MIHLCVYVPHSHVEIVKAALFAAGAGRIGHYDSCCWQTEGVGQYRPLEGSQPFLGQTNQTEVVGEVKLEMICSEDKWAEVVSALKESHPYETPAYHGLKVIL